MFIGIPEKTHQCSQNYIIKCPDFHLNQQGILKYHSLKIHRIHIYVYIDACMYVIVLFYLCISLLI